MTAERVARLPPPAEPPPQPAAPSRLSVRNAALTTVATIAVVALLHYAQAMVIPIVLAVLISYALDPMIRAAERFRVPRPLGAAVLLVLLVAAGGGLLYGLRAEAGAIVDQLPQAARQVRDLLEKGARPTPIEKVQKAASELEKAANGAAAPPPAPAGVTPVQVEHPPFNVGNYLVWGSISVATAVGELVLILFLVFFLLASGDLYRRKLVAIAGPSLASRRVTARILVDIDRQIESFLLGQAAASLAVGVATWLAFRWLGVAQPAVWGLVTGIAASIPYFGPVVTTAVAAGVGLVQFGTLRMMFAVGGASFAITGLEAWLLARWLTGRAVRMNAVAVFIGLLFWGWVWNLWGLLLAVPMLMVLKAICDHVEDFRPVGELLGE